MAVPAVGAEEPAAVDVRRRVPARLHSRATPTTACADAHAGARGRAFPARRARRRRRARRACCERYSGRGGGARGRARPVRDPGGRRAGARATGDLRDVDGRRRPRDGHDPQHDAVDGGATARTRCGTRCARRTRCCAGGRFVSATETPGARTAAVAGAGRRRRGARVADHPRGPPADRARVARATCSTAARSTGCWRSTSSR